MTPEIDSKAAWSLPSVMDYFANHRKTSAQVYESEWFFLKPLLKEGMSVLDIGCAQGGFAGVLGENLTRFEYTGIDISSTMIGQARQNFPQHQFFVTSENTYPQIPNQNFDLVLCLGILHLNSCWREMLTEAWQKTRRHLLMDFREHGGTTIEDISKSYFLMNFNGEEKTEAKLPYVILNSGEALDTLKESCKEYSQLKHFGYEHPVSESAVTPVKKVMMNTYLIERI
jgi:ubiquinone/menaquinone biosynthesis C-methylase UbiE